MYYHGAVNLTNGSAVVTGINTLWNGRVTDTQKFMVLVDDPTIGGNKYGISTIDSNVQITLTGNYTGASTNNVPVYYYIDDDDVILKNFYQVKYQAAHDMLFTFYMTDATDTVLRYTDRPVSSSGIAYGGETYLPKGITWNNLTNSIGGEIENVDIILEDVDGILYDHLMTNAFNKALMTIYFVNRWDDSDFNDFIFKAYVDSFSVTRRDEVKLLCTDVNKTDKLKIRTLGIDCQLGFWPDTRCPVSEPGSADDEYDVDDAATTAGVIAVNHSGAVADSEFWDYSRVILKDGSGNQIRITHGMVWEKTGAQTGTITLRKPLTRLEQPDAVGTWTIELTRKCNRTFDHCKNRFNVQRGFGGFSRVADTIQNLSGVFK